MDRWMDRRTDFGPPWKLAEQATLLQTSKCIWYDILHMIRSLDPFKCIWLYLLKLSLFGHYSNVLCKRNGKKLHTHVNLLEKRGRCSKSSDLHHRISASHIFSHVCSVYGALYLPAAEINTVHVLWHIRVLLFLPWSKRWSPFQLSGILWLPHTTQTHDRQEANKKKIKRNRTSFVATVQVININVVQQTAVSVKILSSPPEI